MSRHVAALVYRKTVGSMARKAILAYCAERANDDGTGVHPSKRRLALEVECTKQTVISTMKSFLKEGILVEAGRRKVPNGYVTVYDMNLPAIEALEDAFAPLNSTGLKLDPVKPVDPTGQTSGPQEVKPFDPNRPITVLEPSIPQTPKGPDLFGDETKEVTKADLDAQSEAEQFEDFWSAYPKKAGKKNARVAFSKALKHATATQIINGAEKYAAYLAQNTTEFRPEPKHAQGWLNGERWNDDEIQGGEAPEVQAERNRYRKIAANGGVAR